jgi:hypothetical protein
MNDTNEHLRAENEQLRAQVQEFTSQRDGLRRVVTAYKANLLTEVARNADSRAQVAQLREALLQASIAPHSETARQLRDAALSTPAPRVFTAEQVLPLAASEIMECAVNNKPIPVIRALATYAEKSNWVQLYCGESSGDYKAHTCEWAFIGPVRPPYELAQNALAHARAIGLLEGKP